MKPTLGKRAPQAEIFLDLTGFSRKNYFQDLAGFGDKSENQCTETKPMYVGGAPRAEDGEWRIT